MNDHWIKAKEWFANLSTREKQYVVGGSIVVGIFIVYQFIFSPLLDSISSMRKRIHSEQNLLVWMQEADKKIQSVEKESHNQGKSLTPVVLLGVIQKEVKASGLEHSLQNLKQSNANAVELSFQKVEFDRLIKLLTALIKAYGVTMTQMSVTADTAPGVVNAELIISV